MSCRGSPASFDACGVPAPRLHGDNPRAPARAGRPVRSIRVSFLPNGHGYVRGVSRCSAAELRRRGAGGIRTRGRRVMISLILRPIRFGLSRFGGADLVLCEGRAPCHFGHGAFRPRRDSNPLPSLNGNLRAPARTRLKQMCRLPKSPSAVKDILQFL